METKDSYREAVAEIEQILRQMEAGEPDVDAMVVHVKRVTELLAYCKKKLSETEEEVQRILDSMEN
jgi:exodeoxyribonuclease VII small subunit